MWWGNFREGDLFGDLSKGDRIILKWIHKKDTWVKNEFISVSRNTRTDYCKFSDLINCGEFLHCRKTIIIVNRTLFIKFYYILGARKLGIANGFPAGPIYSYFSLSQTFRPFLVPAHPHFQKLPRAVIAVQIGRGAILTNQLHVTSKLVRGVFIVVPPGRLVPFCII